MRKNPLPLVISLILITGILPLILYSSIVLRAPSIDIQEASRLLGQTDAEYVLVDVRKAKDFERIHLEGASSLPLAKIIAMESISDIPPSLTDGTLLLICENGFTSAISTLKLRALGSHQIFSIRGGLQSWVAEAGMENGLSPLLFRLEGGMLEAYPSVALPLFKQGMVVLSLYMIKPIYTIISLGLIYILRRENSSHLIALRWSLIFFFFGELACWINFQFLKVESILLEYLHSFSMVLTIAFITYATVNVLDKKVLRFSDPESRCVLLGMCQGCIKQSQVPCKLRRIFQLSVLILALVAFMPFQAQPSDVSYNSTIFGFPRNLMHPVVIQLYEIRYCPLLAIGFFFSSFFLLQLRKQGNTQLEKITLSAGFGYLGFSFLRLAVLTFYRDDIVWFVFWEEATELMLMGGLLYVVWTFRSDLLHHL